MQVKADDNSLLFLFMASCYILYSESIDRYYLGSTTLPVQVRLARHNENYYDGKWTAY